MRILVCGSRGFQDRDIITARLASHIDDNPILIHGGARGADQIADDWATRSHLPIEVYKAQWSKYGKAAGPIRNQEMIDHGKPDLCIAFWDGKSKGTLDMIRRAQAAGIPTEIVLQNGS